MHEARFRQALACLTGFRRALRDAGYSDEAADGVLRAFQAGTYSAVEDWSVDP